MKKHMLIDNPTVSNIVFYPRKTVIPSNLGPDIEVLKFDVGDEVVIGGFFYKNSPELPTILLFHGNGEVALDYQSIAPMFFECDVNLAVIDFRGYGFSSGEPYYSSLISDAMPVFTEFTEWMVEQNISDSLFVQGRSLGSICAAEIGAHNPPNVRGIIFESGFASAYNMMVKLFRVSSPYLTPKSLNKYSNDTRVKKFAKPTLIIHGTMDWIIQVSEADLLYKNLPSTINKKMVLIEGAGHNNILSFEEEYFTPLSDFIKQNK
ncbi:MAG: alpha/beta hydrolase [Promethearchaeota archaeon]|jgi:alpha-beta hydrolase superfamily lysophospholipase